MELRFCSLDPSDLPQRTRPLLYHWQRERIHMVQTRMTTTQTLGVAHGLSGLGLIRNHHDRLLLSELTVLPHRVVLMFPRRILTHFVEKMHFWRSSCPGVLRVRSWMTTTTAGPLVRLLIISMMIWRNSSRSTTLTGLSLILLQVTHLQQPQRQLPSHNHLRRSTMKRRGFARRNLFVLSHRNTRRGSIGHQGVWRIRRIQAIN